MKVCIVQDSWKSSGSSACIDLEIFPGVYEAIGVDGNRIISWQDENGVDSGGVDRFGGLLAPGFPIFSGLAWTLIEPVYLEGPKLTELVCESRRVSAQSDNRTVQATLNVLCAFAERALSESKLLCFLY